MADSSRPVRVKICGLTRPEDAFRLTVLQPGWLRLQTPERLDADAARRNRWIFDFVEHRHFLLDLADVKFIDSTCVGLLLQLRKSVQVSGRRLVLLAPSRAVQKALKLMRMQNLFLTAADALEARALIETATVGQWKEVT